MTRTSLEPRRDLDRTWFKPGPGATGQERFVRHAKKDGRSVTVLRAVDYGDSCIVEADVFPAGSTDAVLGTQGSPVGPRLLRAE